MRNLFLHIGLSKTGSSALQSWLSLNSKKLKETDYYYADLNPAAKNGKITSGNGVKLFKASQEEDLDEVKRLITKVYFKDNNNAIISSETLQGLSDKVLQYIKTICEKESINIKIISYVRSAYELSYSNYLQGVKRHGFTMDFSEFKNVNYAPQRNSLKRFFNIFHNDLTVINYDKMTHDIFYSFSEIIGINAQKLLPLKTKVNRSLTRNELKTLTELNKIHKGKLSARISDHIIHKSPDVITQVHYDEEILRNISDEAKENIDWINENLNPIGGFLEITNRKSKTPQSETNISFDNIYNDISEWAFSDSTVEKLSNEKYYIDFLRDFAIFMEDKDINLSEKLMTLASHLRPNGKFIQNKIEYYKKQKHESN